MEAMPNDSMKTMHTGMYYVTHPSCLCHGGDRSTMLVGLRGTVSFSEAHIGRILTFVRLYIESTRNDMLRHIFIHGGCPADFDLDHPCWGCWLDAHLKVVEQDGLSFYSKQVQCNSGDAILRMLVLTFTCLCSRGSLELICDNIQEEKVNAIYFSAKKWFTEACTRAQTRDRLEDK